MSTLFAIHLAIFRHIIGTGCDLFKLQDKYGNKLSIFKVNTVRLSIFFLFIFFLVKKFHL